MPVPTAARQSSAVSAATAQRLSAAAHVALGRERSREDRLTDGALALRDLSAALVATPRADLAWLALTALTGAYPTADQVRSLTRTARLNPEREVSWAAMELSLGPARRHDSAHRPARVVSHPVVDLDLCARSDFHNGIQRVARETAQRWAQRHQVTPVAWTDTGGSLRDLTRQEELRTTRWSSRHTEIDTGVGPGPAAAAGDEFGLVIPWHTTVVLAEVPLADRCASLSGLAELSGNAVVAIGYDAIPVVSADLRPLGEANAFAAYLTVIKHSARVAGISTSATVEFEGFSQALASQGLPGPEVREVLLPSDVPPPPPGFRRTPSARPRVLSVGRTEPHKNHGALLHAAELLWREGLEFDLDLIGAKGWSTSRVDEQLERLTRAGRPVRWLGPVPDDELWAAIRNASFTVFASLHEGFGLPVSESLACGTPVVTTGYGSQGEIAAGGGCLVVDPRDDADLTAAMRRLLTEPGLEDRLRREALERPDRTWDDYAAELWSVLVEGKQP